MNLQDNSQAPAQLSRRLRLESGSGKGLWPQRSESIEFNVVSGVVPVRKHWAGLTGARRAEYVVVGSMDVCSGALGP